MVVAGKDGSQQYTFILTYNSFIKFALSSSNKAASCKRREVRLSWEVTQLLSITSRTDGNKFKSEMLTREIVEASSRHSAEYPA